MSKRQRFSVKDLPIISEGRESIVYNLGQGKAIKLFLDPDDEDFHGDADDARKKLQAMQTKLFDFPKNLPERVIGPQDLANDSGQICGYTMRYLDGATELAKYGEKPFRREKNIDNKDMANNVIVPVFRDLHHTVSKIHEANVIIGDFRDTNVLVKGNAAYIIDADSFQFGAYPCGVGVPDFTDPLLFDDLAEDFVLKKGVKASTDTDWYAYTAMLARSLLLVKPYGGTYVPNENISLRERIRQRITIFHEDVDLPPWATHPSALPDDLLQYFKAVLGRKNKRGIFPARLLEMRWIECPDCGVEHARSKCPKCQGLVLTTLISSQRVVHPQRPPRAPSPVIPPQKPRGQNQFKDALRDFVKGFKKGWFKPFFFS
jgi:DNA-binding helix-hairpin-helix protein with protein kinase domain